MCSEITTIVFSKNRACQLELLLRSLNIPVTVIYTYDPDFKTGYDKLIKMYPEVKFIKENNFKSQVIEALGEYTMFLVDDDVMIEPLNDVFPEFEKFKQDEKIICLSLRLAPYYKHSQTFIDGYLWKWRGHLHSWGYPMSVSSHIFRKEDILPIMAETEFAIPNDLEVVLRRKPPARPLMMCLSQPKFINNLANQVQSKYKYQNKGIPIEELNDKFLSGQRISFEDIKEKAKKANSPFIKIDYTYEIY